jgi:AcrR family transcriptional regulator
MTESELKQEIIKKASLLFNRDGLKFTMDDLARELHISKKTIYKIIPDKKSLFNMMVDDIFDSIKQEEKNSLEDESSSTLEKLRRTLGAMPEEYYNINFQNLNVLKEKYPKIYAHVEQRLETGWEQTIELLEKAMEEGVIRRISIPIFKTMFQATIEQFFQRDVLIENQIPYQEALQEVVSIMIDGIVISEEGN